GRRRPCTAPGAARAVARPRRRGTRRRAPPPRGRTRRRAPRRLGQRARSRPRGSRGRWRTRRAGVGRSRALRSPSSRRRLALAEAALLLTGVGVDDRFDRAFAGERGQDEAFLEGRHRGQPEDRLRLLRACLPVAERLHEPRLVDVADLLGAHVGADGKQLLVDGANDRLVAPGEQARQVAERQAGLLERAQLEVGGAVAVDLVVAVADGGEHGQHRRNVEEHRQGAKLRMERQRQLPLLDEAVDGRVAGRLELVVADPVPLRSRDHLRVVRVLDQVAVGVDEGRLVGGRRLLEALGVVEQKAEVADPPDAGVEAGGGMARLEARVAEDALLRLAGRPVEVGLLVRATGDAHPPGAALVLAEQDDSVLAALVDRPGGTGGDAGGVDTVVADPRQVEEDHPLELVQLRPLLLAETGEVWVVGGVDGRAAEVVVPVRPRLDLHVPAGDHRDRPGGRLIVSLGGVEQLVELVRPRLVVVVDRRQRGVGEDVRERAAAALELQLQLPPSLLPAALVALLVLPQGRVAGAGLRLDVVPPHVLGAFAVGPDVLAGDRAGVATDALVEVEDHRHLRADVHHHSSRSSFFTTAYVSRVKTPIGPQ